MRRREFIGLAGAAAGWPLMARAQEAGRTYRVGFLTAADRDPAILKQCLKACGSLASSRAGT